MASILMNILQTSFNFFVPVDNLNKYESGEFIVAQVPWHFLIKKILTEDENKNKNNVKLQIMLVCKYDEEDMPENSMWSIESEAVVKLKSFIDCVQSIILVFPLTKFHSDCKISEPKNISLLNGQVNGINSINFIKDGHFEFEAIVKSKPLRIDKMHVTSFSNTRFGFEIKNVKDLTAQNTPTFSLQGIEWYIRFEKKEEYLSIFLYPRHRPEHFGWSFNITCFIKLLAVDDIDKSYEKQFKKRFYSGVLGWGYSKFIAWNDFINRKYVENDAFFEISIESEPMQPLWKYFDGALHIDGLSSLKCPICFEKFDEQEISSTACGHLFCDRCIRNAIGINGKCSLCNEDVSVNDLRITYLP